MCKYHSSRARGQIWQEFFTLYLIAFKLHPGQLIVWFNSTRAFFRTSTKFSKVAVSYSTQFYLPCEDCWFHCWFHLTFMPGILLCLSPVHFIQVMNYITGCRCFWWKLNERVFTVEWWKCLNRNPKYFSSIQLEDKNHLSPLAVSKWPGFWGEVKSELNYFTRSVEWFFRGGPYNLVVPGVPCAVYQCHWSCLFMWGGQNVLNRNLLPLQWNHFLFFGWSFIKNLKRHQIYIWQMLHSSDISS